MEVFFKDHEFYDEFTNLYVQLMDSNSPKFKKILDSVVSENLDQEFIHLSSTINCDFFLSIAEKQFPNNPTVVSISQIKKPNFHWLFSELAAAHKLSLEYHEFSNNPQIEKFFEDIFKAPIRIDKIYYIDRYVRNLTKHRCFATLKGKNYNVEVLTYEIKSIPKNGNAIRYTPVELNAMKADSVTTFGASCRFFYTQSKTLIHERKVLFNNLIINSNEDFSKLKTHNQTWTIDITYSRVNYSKFVEKTALFTELV
ncbi:MAG: hypothetical protein V4635_06935 [Bacteroidota bacterium]